MELKCEGDMIRLMPESGLDTFRLGQLCERVQSVSVRWQHEKDVYTVEFIAIEKEVLLKQLLGEAN